MFGEYLFTMYLSVMLIGVGYLMVMLSVIIENRRLSKARGGFWVCGDAVRFSRCDSDEWS